MAITTSVVSGVKDSAAPRSLRACQPEILSQVAMKNPALWAARFGLSVPNDNENLSTALPVPLIMKNRPDSAVAPLGPSDSNAVSSPTVALPPSVRTSVSDARYAPRVA